MWLFVLHRKCTTRVLFLSYSVADNFPISNIPEISSSMSFSYYNFTLFIDFFSTEAYSDLLSWLCRRASAQEVNKMLLYEKYIVYLEITFKVGKHFGMRCCCFLI